jgi:peptidyl-prolyl cis-trans isomerase B (cyclophilin B)
VSKAAKRERQKQNRELARIERERMVKRQRQMKSLRTLGLLLAPLVVIAVIIAIFSGGGDSSSSKVTTLTPQQRAACADPVKNPTRTFAAPPPMTIDATAKYTATLCTSEGVIELSLDAAGAPVATNNFVFLAQEGFYDGLTIHRAAKDFVIQGGDPKGDGSGGPGYTVAGEIPTDHYPVGSLAAAKTSAEPAGTMGSQFFIVTGANGATLPNDYARFGKVTSGLKAAQSIEKLAPPSGDGVPTKKVTITKLFVEKDGQRLAPTTTTSSAP